MSKSIVPPVFVEDFLTSFSTVIFSSLNWIYCFRFGAETACVISLILFTLLLLEPTYLLLLFIVIFNSMGSELRKAFDCTNLGLILVPLDVIVSPRLLLGLNPRSMIFFSYSVSEIRPWVSCTD